MSRPALAAALFTAVVVAVVLAPRLRTACEVAPPISVAVPAAPAMPAMPMIPEMPLIPEFRPVVPLTPGGMIPEATEPGLPVPPPAPQIVLPPPDIEWD